MIPNSQVNASSSVHIYPEVGHLPSTCGSTDRQCWVYARWVVCLEAGKGAAMIACPCVLCQGPFIWV
jgi:hypothetical protein